MTQYLAQNLFASFCFLSHDTSGARRAEKIDNRDKQLQPDGMALGRAEGGARLLGAESVSRTQEPVALRECGCEPGKALSVKRNEMKASALSVQMSSLKWSICRRQGCREATHPGFRA